METTATATKVILKADGGYIGLEDVTFPVTLSLTDSNVRSIDPQGRLVYLLVEELIALGGDPDAFDAYSEPDGYPFLVGEEVIYCD